METFRCEWCGDVIGVYEPMIISADGKIRQTSRLIEGSRDGGPLGGEARLRRGDRYHEACFEQAHAQAHRLRLRRARAA